MQDYPEDAPLKTTDILSQWLSERQTEPTHRQLLVVAGSLDFCRDITHRLICDSRHSAILSIGESSLELPNTRPLKSSSTLLGQESDLALYDAFDAIRPNAILALAGTLRSGGIMVFCCPGLDDWAVYQELSVGHYLSYGERAPQSNFRQQLADSFNSDDRINLLTEQEGSRLSIQRPLTNPEFPEHPFKTLDQARCFQQLTNRRTTQVLITADRGRGKSVLMGLVAGRYMQWGYNVIVTSRYAEATTQIFYGIRIQCPDAIMQDDHQLLVSEFNCKWAPLDYTIEQLSSQSPALAKTVLLVDEAASVPIPQLKLLCSHPGPLYLSSTMRGYEGSGRGFINRFYPWARQHLANLIHLSLKTPVRWFEKDPVEDFWYQAFHLTSDTLVIDEIETPTNTWSKDDITIVRLHKSQLSPEVCDQIVPLLMQSHYQTTADELIRLVDSPNNNLIAAIYKDSIIGVLNYQQEGGPDLKAVSTDICCGNRRVNGHLSAQSLALMTANPELALLTYWRVIRIAVSKIFRRRGIASKMLDTLGVLAVNNNIDALTTSYGATPDLVNFWQRQQFTPVKPGLKKDASSGEYSLLMIRSFTEEIIPAQPLIEAMFQQELRLHPTPENFMVGHFDNQTIKIKDLDLIYQRILSQVLNGTRRLQHANSAIAWLIKNRQIIKHNASSSHIRVLELYLASINSPKEFIEAFKLPGKRAIEGFVVEHLKAIVDTDKYEI